MPFVRGFLRVGRRHRPGHPDIGLPDPELPVDPDYGIDEGGEIWPGPGEPGHPLPQPPPGIWPPLTPENPWRPIDPGWGQGRPMPPRPGQGLPGSGPTRPDQGLPGQPPQPGQPLPPTEGPGGPEVQPPIQLPPGMIWPPLPEGVEGHYLALVLIAGAQGVRYHYTVIDAGLRPGNRPPGTRPPRPDQGLPRPPGGGGHPDQGLPGEQPTPEPSRRTG